MSRKRYTRNESDIQELLKRGRGKGFGRNYLPYIFVRDIPSSGRSHRIYGRRSGRVHHLLSDIEYAHYLNFDNDDLVTDIREQLALDRTETVRIANILGFRHPRDPRSDTNLVMTTDLVVTYKHDSAYADAAFSIKPASQLTNRRVCEKLKIEATYWATKNIRFQVLTEKDIPLHLKRSLQWLRQYQDMHLFTEPYPGHYKELAEHLLICLSQPSVPDLTLCEVCKLLDEHLAYETGSHLMIARHMLATRVLLTELNREQLWNTPIFEIKINNCLPVEN